MGLSLTIMESAPAKSGGGCSSGCGSQEGGCGSHGGHDHAAAGPAELVHTDVLFAQRRLNLAATPDIGTYVTSIDLDLTVQCNLRCTYCFKEKWDEHMEDQVAFDALIWLLHASGPKTEVSVNFMGGEPLIRFRLIQRIVPFAKRRAWQMGKNIHFGMTTNGTLVTDEVIAFWKKWGMGFHTSIDGTPDVQDRNRPTLSGRGSARECHSGRESLLAFAALHVTLSAMPRRPRVALGGMFFHVLNRAVGRGALFDTPADYTAFERVIEEVHARLPTRLLAYCLMPNHWHLVLWPRADGELSEFMRRLTVTHTQRWHACHRTAGTGPLYQGRFKSFPIERDEHLLAVSRYVERNALRAGLCKKAEAWRWGSPWKRVNDPATPWLMDWADCPVDRPARWLRWVNLPQSPTEEAAIVESIRRGRPFGKPAWQRSTAARLTLQSTLRPRGRPRQTTTIDSRPEWHSLKDRS